MFQKPKIFISRKIPSGGIEILKGAFDVQIWEHKLPPDRDELLDACKDAYGVITLLSDKIDKTFIDSCPSLKIISNYAVGYNNIDVGYAKERGIAVCNTPDVLTDATADLAVTLLLATLRKIKPAWQNAIGGHWETWDPMGFIGGSLQNKTLGILGPGRIGFAAASKLKKGWDMNILYSGPNRKTDFENKLDASFVDIETLFKESDALSIHCPLNAKTHHLVDNTMLRLMKKTAVIVNTARGEIINQNDLTKVLGEHAILGAGLDVTTPEPLPASHALFKLDNCVILPHIGSATEEARQAMSLLCAKNILELHKGNQPITPL